MQRFIERQNIERFEGLLRREMDEARRRTLRSLLSESRRRLALLNAISEGAYLNNWWPGRDSKVQNRRAISAFQEDFEISSKPYVVIDPRPGLHIVDVNNAFSVATETRRGALAGQRLFDAFPDNPEVPTADGVCNVYASLEFAVKTGQTHAMPVQRFDIRDENGRFIERYWRSLNTPLFGEEGELIYLLHHSVDVTSQVVGKREGPLIPTD